MAFVSSAGEMDTIVELLTFNLKRSTMRINSFQINIKTS